MHNCVVDSMKTLTAYMRVNVVLTTLKLDIRNQVEANAELLLVCSGAGRMVFHELLLVLLPILAELEDLLGELGILLHELGDQLLVLDEFLLLGIGGGLGGHDLLLGTALLAINAE